VEANVVHRSPILVTRVMEALSSSEKSAFTRATRCNIPENAILHSHEELATKQMWNLDKSSDEQRFISDTYSNWGSSEVLRHS
jgi:hypothetical protein